MCNEMKEQANTRHVLQLMEQFVRPTIEGRKRYDVRYGDRGFQAGDEVVYRVVDSHKRVYAPGSEPDHRPLQYCTDEEAKLIEGRVYRIDYVMTFEGLAPGYVAFSISEK